jgi:hypothetical protein
MWHRQGRGYTAAVVDLDQCRSPTRRRLSPLMNSPVVGVVLEHASELRELAAWYREFADRAGDPGIWESRLLFAAELDELAARIKLEHQLKANQQIGGTGGAG